MALLANSIRVSNFEDGRLNWKIVLLFKETSVGYNCCNSVPSTKAFKPVGVFWNVQATFELTEIPVLLIEVKTQFCSLISNTPSLSSSKSLTSVTPSPSVSVHALTELNKA